MRTYQPQSHLQSSRHSEKDVEVSVRMEGNAAMESVSVARALRANSVTKKKRAWAPSSSGSSLSLLCYSLLSWFSSEARIFRRRY